MSRYYMPTATETTEMIERAIAKQPSIERYAWRAAKICQQADFYHTPDGWKVFSQSKGTNQTYTVRGATCTCPSYTDGKAPTIQGFTFCKHIIALVTYRRILQTHLNDRILGSIDDSWDWNTCQHYPNSYLLTDENQKVVTFRYFQDKIPTRVCYVTHYPDLKPSYVFTHSEDVAAFAIWLYQAEPLPRHDNDAMTALHAYRMALATGHNADIAAEIADATLTRSFTDYQHMKEQI